MTEIGKYIYGVINTDSNIQGIGVGVYTISYKDISAVVSDSEVTDYTNLLKDALARYLLRHQQVIEKIMENFTIIPMRLGTYCIDEDEVRHILAKGYCRIRDIFKEIDGKIEIDVVAMWNIFDDVIKEIAEEEEIKEFKQSLLNKKEGVTLNEQMKIGVLIKGYLDKKREKYFHRIESSLKEISHDYRTHVPMDDKMVINSAFMIEKSRQKDFGKMVEDLDNEFAEKLNFRCVGPLPPYSFRTLEVKKMRFDEISLAKNKLNLNDAATKDEIEKAYRRMAQVYHPDRNQMQSDSQEQFDELNRAYKMLLEYCQDEVCSFEEKEFGRNAIIVKPMSL